jgi:methionyl-tRNA formyltransferase
VSSRSPLVFLGSPQVSADVLRVLVVDGHDIKLVITAPDRRRGRGGETSPTPVGAAAAELGLPVSYDTNDAATCGAMLGVVVAYGEIIRPHVLSVTPMVNLHFSLLPRWRGAAPVERAILSGDIETGVCVMEVVEALDAGGLYASASIPITHETTASSLTTELGAIGANLLLSCLENGLGEPAPQVGEVTYAAKMTADDRHIDWTQPNEVVLRTVRIGGAWTTWRGERFRIHDAQVVDGAIIPLLVQPAGKPKMSFDDWVRGARPEDGEWFE